MTPAPSPDVSHWLPDPGDPAPLEMSVGALLRRAAIAVPERIALVDACGDAAIDPRQRRRWTYAELLARVEAVAARLAASVRPGERLAIWAPSSAEWLIADLAAALAGVVLVPLNPVSPRSEVTQLLRRAGPAMLLHGREHRGVDLAELAAGVAAEVGGIETVAELGELVGTASAVPPAAPLPEVDASAVVQIQFTSGTTGAPKGVLLHHRGLVGMPATAVELLGLGGPPVWLNVMPLHHIGGCGLSTTGPLTAFGTQVLSDRFTPERALSLIESERVTVFGSVPTMLIGMLEHPGLSARDVASLEVVISGGATVSAALVRRIESTLGVRFVVAFGQTECHGHITQTRPTDADDDKAETCGRPLPGVEVKLVEPATGVVVPLGAVGEVCTRSPWLMRGYLDDPAATATVLDADGFLHTGDLCSMDARGYVTFVGRIKDMIVRGGENISPREIEERLRGHGAVADVAVIGVPHERLGEVVAAAVCVQPGSRTTVDELAAWAAAALAAFKVPTEWRLVDALPTTSNGKVHKPSLKAGWEHLPRVDTGLAVEE